MQFAQRTVVRACPQPRALYSRVWCLQISLTIQFATAATTQPERMRVHTKSQASFGARQQRNREVTVSRKATVRLQRELQTRIAAEGARSVWQTYSIGSRDSVNALYNALLAQNEHEEALELFEVRCNQKEASDYEYGFAITACDALGRHTAADAVFEEGLESAKAADRWGLHFPRSYVCSFAKRSDAISAAVSRLIELQSAYAQDPERHNCLLRVLAGLYALQGDLDRAVSATELQGLAQGALVSDYSRLLLDCRAAGRWDLSLQVLGQVQNRQVFAKNPALIALLTLLEQKQWVEAWDLWLAAKDGAGWAVKEVVNVHKVCAKAGNRCLADDILQHIKSLNRSVRSVRSRSRQ